MAQGTPMAWQAVQPKPLAGFACSLAPVVVGTAFLLAEVSLHKQPGGKQSP
jgi:hypothetical protein